jgi:hypothetical protein
MYIAHEDPNAFLFFSLFSDLSAIPLTRARWGCLGSNAMVIPITNFTAAHNLNKR